MLGGSGAYASSPEKIRKMWCSFVRFGVYFDESVKNSLKINLFLYKKYLLYTCRYTFAMGYL